MSSIMQQIEQAVQDQSPSFQKVATFLFEHKNEIVFLKLDDLSKQIGVSTTTVLRFTRDLGFSGYKDFQRRLQDELLSKMTSDDKLESIRRSTSPSDLLSKVSACAIQNIQKTVAYVDREREQQLLEILTNTERRIYFLGMRGSYALAHYAYTRLSPLLNDAILLSPDISDSIEALMPMGENDACVHFLFHRYTARGVQILREMHSRKVKTILVTDLPVDSIARYAEVILPCQVSGVSPRNSLVAPIFLVDYLCAALSLKDYQTSRKKYEEAKELVARNHIILDI